MNSLNQMPYTWICPRCGTSNVGYGECVYDDCTYFLVDKNTTGEILQEKQLPTATVTTQFKTKYDVIFELHRLGAMLTGSRAFGTEKETSDWDFVISEDNARGDSDVWLHFKTASSLETDYKDCNTVRVLESKKFNIHVQVSKDIKKKLAAQALLLSMPPVMQEKLLNMDSKMGRRRVWDWALAQVGGKN